MLRKAKDDYSSRAKSREGLGRAEEGKSSAESEDRRFGSEMNQEHYDRSFS